MYTCPHLHIQKNRTCRMTQGMDREVSQMLDSLLEQEPSGVGCRTHADWEKHAQGPTVKPAHKHDGSCLLSLMCKVLSCPDAATLTAQILVAAVRRSFKPGCAAAAGAHATAAWRVSWLRGVEDTRLCVRIFMQLQQGWQLLHVTNLPSHSNRSSKLYWSQIITYIPRHYLRYTAAFTPQVRVLYNTTIDIAIPRCSGVMLCVLLFLASFNPLKSLPLCFISDG